MSFKWLGINIVLCVLAVFLGFENYETWNHPYKPLTDRVTVPEKSKTKEENPPMPVSTKEAASAKSYNLISEKNIFSPERKDFPVPAAAMAEAPRPIVRPQIVLYGVTIGTDYQSAIVVNPGRPLRKNERETLTLKLGEKVGEYKLAKILPDRISMENNGDTFEVLLYDPKNPKRRMEVRTETEPAVIASAQPTPAPSSAEPPKTTPSQRPAGKPKETVQTQVLPFNKYTYRLLGPSAAISRGKIVSSSFESPAQESIN